MVLKNLKISAHCPSSSQINSKSITFALIGTRRVIASMHWATKQVSFAYASLKVLKNKLRCIAI